MFILSFQIVAAIVETLYRTIVPAKEARDGYVVF
jgi:hypothetical protein